MQLQLVALKDELDRQEEARQSTLERELYAPVLASLKRFWIPKEEIRDYVIEITANQGSRNTGGLWTRPDIVCIGASCFPYVPGRTLDVTTFEIKKTVAEGVAGVYETAAHSAFSHRSFLVLHTHERLSSRDSDDYFRVMTECKRFGLGLITFLSPNVVESYSVAVDAAFRSPAPQLLNRFIAGQISEEGRQSLLVMFR